MSDVMKKVVLASGNKGKIAEFQKLLMPFGHEVVAQSELNIEGAEETGLSFIENAILKARHAAEQSGLPALADDSGLMVPALRGEPGIYSARYAGPSASDEDNIELLLKNLAEQPDLDRQAKFICALVWVRHATDPLPVVAIGEWNGAITEARSGDQGFGYDPIFWVPEKQCAAAQLSKEQKNALSHRGKASTELLARLKELGELELSQ